MIFTIQKTIELLVTYKYEVIFPIAVIEGPAISILSGTLAYTGLLNIYFTYALLVCADLVGDTMYYLMGKFGGLYFIKRWNHILKIDEHKVILLERMFENHGAKIIFLGKAQGLGSLALMAAGLTKYDYGKFILYNAIATLIKTFILLYVGYFFALQFTTANNIIFKIGVEMTFVSLLALYFYIRKQHKKV